ncbi:MAG: DNA polymerase III subunit delta' [Anaerolineae bacterium]|nr:DNA polymerase III subunit delta' [Anaerolineae bacterium]
MAWEVIGHDWAVALLREGLAKGRVTHAYLFTGPPQIGKTHLAQVLAQALNCEEPDPPCGRCSSCLKIAGGTHPDVRVIVGEGAGESIKIDQVRSLQREAILLPYEGRYRVFILRLMDQATMEAANSLLKTLEEPPAHVVLALTAVQAEVLPPTVVSRCQRLDLRPVSLRQVESALEDRGLADEQARLLARLSGGRIGWALEAARGEGTFPQRQQGLEQLMQLLSATRVERFDFASKVSRDVDSCRALIELWASWWRDLLLLTAPAQAAPAQAAPAQAASAQGHIVNLDRAGELEQVASHTDLSRAWAVLAALESTVARLDANVNVRLALEGLLLKLPHWAAVAGTGGATSPQANE